MEEEGRRVGEEKEVSRGKREERMGKEKTVRSYLVTTTDAKAIQT